MRTVYKVTNLTSSFFRKFLSCNFQSFQYKMSSQFSHSTTDTTTSSEHYETIKKIQQFIPKLMFNLRKGDCGRIGIIGGSAEYTGAPYFAAISSLKLGADLAFVFCCREAAPVIKSYSPELIVLPILDSNDVIQKIEPWLTRLHVLVVGPGLGRDPGLLKNVGNIINHCKVKLKPSPPLVIDADGLYLINEDFSLIKNYKGPLILTPNAFEYSRLQGKLSVSEPFEVAVALNALLVQKGFTDLIINAIHNKITQFPPSEATFLCDVPGSNRRCGGQGDILSGCLATFIAWLHLHFQRINFELNPDDQVIENYPEVKEQIMAYSVAAYGACTITKTCSRLAFERFGRGMTATDMIPLIQEAFRLHFGQ